MTFVNETIKQLIAENKINDNFKIIMEPDDEVRSLLNDELNETLDGSSTAPKFVDEKELEILIIATIDTLKRKRKNADRRKSLILSKIH